MEEGVRRFGKPHLPDGERGHHEEEGVRRFGKRTLPDSEGGFHAEEETALEDGILEGYLPRLSREEARALAPLTLAFVGDAVYELLNRTRLVQEADRNPKELQRRASAFARAPFQSAAMGLLEPHLTKEELEIYHRGRNAKSKTTAKNASVLDYRRATGFEAVIGYLYLVGDVERILRLVQMGNEQGLLSASESDPCCLDADRKP